MFSKRSCEQTDRQTDRQTDKSKIRGPPTESRGTKKNTMVRNYD